MVQKPPGSGVWLFPQCFHYLLQHQLPSGGWEAYASPADGILNTAAGLLALRQHLEVDPMQEDWETRSRKAASALQQMLREWNVLGSDQVGFEMLMVQHLFLLQRAGVKLDFPQRKALQAIYDAKLKAHSMSSLYEAPSTMLHSLEAFIGHVHFDRLGGFRDENGSMMGSPSSTAAYLMHVSYRDDDAEVYLRNVVLRGKSNDGGVPSAWPTTVFEASWVLTTLIAAGYPVTETEALSITRFLEETLNSQLGITGFAPSTLADSDDTARALIALRYAGKHISVQHMIDTYEGKTHFKTYHGERNSSFSANCNVLTCLLGLTDEQRVTYVPQIAKAMSYLCREAFKDSVRDKWHRNEMYWKMLLVQAFALFCDFEGADSAEHAVLQANPLLKEHIPIISCQILAEILDNQHSDGSWDGMHEVTAYAVLALSSIAGLPWIQSLDDSTLQDAIGNGKAYLLQCRHVWKKGSHLWIEKVTYGSDALSEAYCIAAVAAIFPAPRTGSQRSSLDGFALPSPVSRGLKAASAMVQRTNMQFSRFRLQVAEVQSCYALLGLQRRRHEFFPAMEEGKYKYLPMTALIWMACHSRYRSSLSLLDLHEMMVLSMVVYQVDQYVESIIERQDDGWDFSLIEARIWQVCQEHSPDQTLGFSPPLGEREKSPEILVNGSKQALEDVGLTLGRVAAYVLQHPAVLGSPAELQKRVSDEFRTFLLAHIAQARDNRRFRGQKVTASASRSQDGLPSPYSAPVEYQSPSQTFYGWVRTTSANHTSCPLAWVFFHCLVAAKPSSPQNKNPFADARTAYVAEDLCRHLASMCRMYNDFASLRRDTEETNLNSLNFPEFHRRIRGSLLAEGGNGGINNGGIGHGGTPQHRLGQENIDLLVREMKDDLMWVAEYERRGLDMATHHLDQELGQKAPLSVAALEVFIDVTDLYGLVYLVKDLTNRVQ